MHIRIRRSKQDPAKQELYLVRADNHDTPDPATQARWDDEQTAQHEFDPVTNPPTTVYIQKRAWATAKRPSDFFTIDFRDLGHKYTFGISSGIGQWSVESGPVRRRGRYKPVPAAALRSRQHGFFGTLVCVDRNTIDNLAALFAGRDGGGGWGCGDEAGHGHYMVRVCLELELGAEFDGVDVKHTIHMICGNARLADVFRELCGSGLKDQFSLTQICRDNIPGSEKSAVVLGTSYTYLTAKTGNMMVQDLGWNVGENNTVWLCGGERSREALLKEMLSWN